MSRQTTWQKDEPPATFQAPQGSQAGQPEGVGWREEAALFGVGLIPVVGPVINATVNFQNGRYIRGSVDIGYAFLDCWTFGCGSKAVAVSGKIAEKGAERLVAHGVSAIGIVKQGITLVRVVSAVTAWSLGEEDASELALISTTAVSGTMPSVPLTPAEARGRAPLPSGKVPLRSLKDSNYLVQYRLYPKRPSPTAIMGTLLPSVRDRYARFLADPAIAGDIGKAAAMMWTDGQDNSIYKALNAAVISDNAGLLAHWVPFIRALNNHILRFEVSSGVVTRRKSWMTADQASRVLVNQDYRLPMYVATSRKTFHNFPLGVGGEAVRIEFNIPARCFQACDLQQCSVYQGEAEVLLIPFTPVRVTGKRTDPTTGIITIAMDVFEDGLNMPLDLPSICA